MEAETEVIEVIKKVGELKSDDELAQKLEEIKLEIDENPETSPKMTDQMKRGSLSKFFRFKNKGEIPEDIAADTGSKIPKSNTLMRMFSKKNKEKPAEKEEVGSEATSRRSCIMRGIVNCQYVPWISRRSSQMNIHNPIEAPEPNDDDTALHEIATCSEIF